MALTRRRFFAAVAALVAAPRVPTVWAPTVAVTEYGVDEYDVLDTTSAADIFDAARFDWTQAVDGSIVYAEAADG